MLIDTYRNGYIKAFKDGVAVCIIQYRDMADYSSYERKKVKMEKNNLYWKTEEFEIVIQEWERRRKNH